MVLRQREPLPIPYEELVALQQELDPEFGSMTWKGPGAQVFVARSPSEEPDLVNDLEAIVDKAAAGDLESADRALIVSARQVHQVPLASLRQLMADRLSFDKRQCAMLRTQLPGSLAHSVYRSPEDPKRRLRLAVRLPCQRVGDVDDRMLEELVEQVGPRLAKGLDEVHCVYLIASEDDVRVDADRFLDDLRSRWDDEDRRRRLEQEAEAKSHEVRRRSRLDREALLSHLEDRYGHKVAYAPVKTSSRIDYVETEGRPMAEPATSLPVDPYDDLHSTVDAIPAPRSQAMTLEEGSGVSTSEPVAVEPRAARPATIQTGDEVLDAAAARLQQAGYEILVRPAVEGHEIHLAGERPEGYPQRVVVLRRDRLGVVAANEFLQACRDLDVDLGIAVTEAVEPEAKRAIVATKVRAVRPDALEHLQL